MADVILVQPKAGGYSETVQRPMLPLALLAAARRIVGTRSVRIIDMRVDDNWRGRLETILSTEPVCVGITSITGSQLRSAVKAASLVREQGDVPIVWGGVHASLLPDQTLASGLADVVVIGDGDETFPRLVDALAEGRDLSRIDGIAFRKGKRTVHTKPAPFVDLDEQPDLPYNLVDIEEYVQMYDGRRTLVVQTSRGCPHSCRFCVNPCYNSSKWRGQSADRVQDVFASMRERFGVENLWLA
ncbi:MAG: cobalamin-dependent protein, partial [Candidatus Undinarchaeales archaeon]|nr:cobalamin-dependent protein [Candidatus Undinarchaeales archaeon]